MTRFWFPQPRCRGGFTYPIYLRALHNSRLMLEHALWDGSGSEPDTLDVYVGSFDPERTTPDGKQMWWYVSSGCMLCVQRFSSGSRRVSCFSYRFYSAVCRVFDFILRASGYGSQINKANLSGTLIPECRFSEEVMGTFLEFHVALSWSGTFFKWCRRSTDFVQNSQ